MEKRRMSATVFPALGYLASVRQKAQQFDVIIPKSHSHDTPPVIPTKLIGLLRF